MAVIQRTDYVSESNCDTMVAALPTMQTAYGRGLRKSNDGGNKVSVYQHTRWQWYPDALKTAWKNSMPSEVVSTYLISSFMKIPANTGILYPTTIGTVAQRGIACFLSVALTDGQHLTINGTKYNVNKGDALLFDGSDTYETETSSSDALWSVNMVPSWKKATYGA